MSFFTLSNGEKPTGDAESAHAAGTLLIPHNTQAIAKIDSFKLIESQTSDFPSFYAVKFELMNTKYKGFYVTLKLKPYDQKKSIQDRAKQMFVRLYHLCQLQPAHSGAPQDNDLLMFKDKILGIKILQWFYQGKEGNFVSEIHSSQNYECKEGEYLTPPTPSGQDVKQQETADQAFSQQQTQTLDDDIPF